MFRMGFALDSRGVSLSLYRPLFKVFPPRGPPNASNLAGHNVSAQRSPRRATPRNSKCFCVDRLGSYGFRTGFVVDSLGFGVVVRCGCVGRLVSYEFRKWVRVVSLWCFVVVV